MAATRIGVMGSSAGGHLAASASTMWDHPDGRTGAALDKSVSARPDFAVLVYPVITMAAPAAPPPAHAKRCWATPPARPCWRNCPWTSR